MEGDNLHNGMILSEVLLAGAILSISILSCVVVIGDWQLAVIDSEKSFNATILARNVINEISFSNFSDLRKDFSNIKLLSSDFVLETSVYYRNKITADLDANIYWYEGVNKKHRNLNSEFVDWKNSSDSLDCDWLESTKGVLNASAFAGLDADLGNTITDIAVRNGFAYVSADSATTTLADLYVLDINDPKDPKIVSSLNTGPGISSVVVVGNYVYAANAGSFQLQVVDVSLASKPVLIAQAKLPGVIVSGGSGYGQSIAYSNKKIYEGLVKANGPEFHVVDVTIPGSPIELSSYEIGGTVNSISVNSSQAFLGTPGAQSVILLDISKPANIATIAQNTLSGWQTQGVSAVNMLGSDFYIGRTLGGFYSPNPELLYSDTMAALVATSSATIGQSVDDLLVYGDYLYVAASDPSKAFEIIPRANIKIVATTFSLPSRAVAISCDKDGMYVVTQNPKDFFHVFN